MATVDQGRGTWWLAVGAILAGCSLLWARSGPVDAATAGAPIVFTQLPVGGAAEREGPLADGMLRADWGEGARVVRLGPDGTVRILSKGFASAADPAVSFDGTRILFAGKKNPGDRWNIFECKADGSEPRQITKGLGDCRSPGYMSTVYTLPPPPRVDTDPWEQVMFLSTAEARMDEFGARLATSLYSIKLDGTVPRRLTFNLSDDMDPFLMPDGRILVAGWQRADLRRGFLGRVSIFGVNLDGLDYSLYIGDEGERVKHMPCVTTDGLVVFVEGDRVPWDGGGRLAGVTVRRNFHSHRPLTEASEGYYVTPSPGRDGTVLVARRPRSGTGNHAVYSFDPATGKSTLIFDDPDYHDLQPRLLAPGPVPRGRSTVVNDSIPTGELYCLNVYTTDQPTLKGLPPGVVKRARVLEGVAVPESERSGYLPPGLSIGLSGPGSHANGIPPVVQKRVLGVVPVEEDGSFSVRVPANLPIQIQTLDEHGMALEASSWMWVKNREARGCIGCHEDPELAPENTFVKAMTRESYKLTLPVERRRTVDFRRDVMPIIEAKCASVQCHGGSSPPALDGGLKLVRHPQGAFFSKAYEELLAADDQAPPTRGGAVKGKYVVPGSARKSPLVWSLFGYDTSGPPGGSVQVESYPVMPPAGSKPLTEDEKLTLMEWIDLGALWDGIPGEDGLPKAESRRRRQGKVVDGAEGEKPR